MTKVIGLTGGIGSGKTTVARFFSDLGVPVFIADNEAKTISESEEVRPLLQSLFGDNVYKAGKLDRKYIASQVFSNPDLLQKLNQVVHPRVQKKFEQWLKIHSKAKYVIKEAAILFESGSYKQCFKVILVTAPQEIRIERVLKRDETDYDSVVKRISNQWSDEIKIPLSDFVIENVNLSHTKSQVLEIHNVLNKI
ncbi:dephospho-CoA kinase [Flavobacterium sp.]|uniref:dephospho-CoA kinase n=1 Tax=Flavobacterium sp. TaxID=239 RepID=UPI002FDB762F